MKWIKNNILNLHIILNILFIFMNSYFYIDRGMDYKVFGRNIIYMLVVNVVFSIILLIIKIKRKEYKFKIYDLLIILISLFGLISTIFAIKPNVSLYGFKGRYEGFYSILYYLSLLFLSSFVKNSDKKKIIYVIIGTGIIEVIYALLQINDSSLVSVSRNFGSIWANGLTSNPNFFSSYVLICLCYMVGLYVEKDDKKYSFLYLLIISFLFSGILISNTTSCMLSFLIIFIYVLFYLFKEKKIDKIIILLIVFIFMFTTIENFGKTRLYSDLVKTKNEAVELSRGNIGDNFGTKRVLIWKKTLKVVPKYLLHGAGIDNYFYMFDDGPLVIGKFFYDKAHNDYLQILVTQGIFSLILYLVLYTVIICRGIVNTKDKSLYLLLPPVAYLIQIFFNISVIEVAPVFFISLGLLVDREKDSYVYKYFIKRVLDIVFSIILIVLLIPVFIIISLLIKIIDGGKIFYVQERTGLNGNVFKIYKFKTIDGKNVLRFGNILRNTSLDEIPQIFNVLKGDMSFVGPRPWIVDYYKLFTDEQKRRVEVRPGITGLAQVNGRNSIDIFKKIEYDLEYVDDVSFILDLKILFKSIKVVFDKDNVDMDMNIKMELKELKNSKKNKKLLK